jgi:phosphoribosylaminoimidazole-succinocarboxamide synthase
MRPPLSVHFSQQPLPVQWRGLRETKMRDVLFETDLKSLPLVGRGKVRDIYTVGDDHLLIVATDRLSAFDVVLPDPIPGKGAVLTAVSNFWFDWSRELVPNHLADIPLEAVLPDARERAQVEGRAIVARRLTALQVEAIVRGYLIGSGWKDYQQNGAVCGIRLPPGLRLADALPEAIFTPSTKAEVGGHDVNIDFARAETLLGKSVAAQVREVSLQLYRGAARYARQRGIIIADTKFEFGLDGDGRLVLIDEVLTPDSSRFWPVEEYRVGISPPSFDKQYVRDYLETLDWNKTVPGPRLPEEVIRRTAEKYREALQRLTGHAAPGG